MLNWFLRQLGFRSIAYNDGINSALVTPRTLAGVHIDEQAALSITAVWCAVSTISNLVAGLPLNVYAHLPNGGKREAPEHPLYDLLHYSPSPELSKESFWSSMMVSTLLHGNGYAEIERSGDGRPVALHVLPTLSVTPFRDPELGLVYEVKVGSDKVYLSPESCFHVAGISPDGITGFSPIKLARESFAMSKAADNFGASFFGNAARPAGVLTTPRALTPNARENLRRSWEQLHAGSGNVGRTAVLEEGTAWQSISIPPEDAQFVQTRQYQVNEIARLYSISPVFLHNGSPAWTDLTQVNQNLVQLTLLPWLQRIEAQIRLKLFTVEERASFFAEHDVTGLLRADTLTRFQAYQIATGGKAWMMPSECRANERLTPIDGIDDDDSQDGDQMEGKEPQTEDKVNNGNTGDPVIPEGN